MIIEKTIVLNGEERMEIHAEVVMSACERPNGLTVVESVSHNPRFVPAKIGKKSRIHQCPDHFYRHLTNKSREAGLFRGRWLHDSPFAVRPGRNQSDEKPGGKTPSGFCVIYI